ncbi:unnamed protein product, partial [Trichobilharzia regenti]
QVKPSSTVGSSSSAILSSSPTGCVDNLVIQQCLEIVIAFTDHFLEIRTRTQLCMTEELQAAMRIISIVGLDTQFLSDLFNLLTRESYSVSLEAAFSSALLNLIHINPVGACIYFFRLFFDVFMTHNTLVGFLCLQFPQWLQASGLNFLHQRLFYRMGLLALCPTFPLYQHYFWINEVKECVSGRGSNPGPCAWPASVLTAIPRRTDS